MQLEPEILNMQIKPSRSQGHAMGQHKYCIICSKRYPVVEIPLSSKKLRSRERLLRSDISRMFLDVSVHAQWKMPRSRLTSCLWKFFV